MDRHPERGAAAVEFALVFVVFATLVMGGLDFGYFFFCKQVVVNGAREGARAGTLTDPASANADSTAIANALSAADAYTRSYGVVCTSYISVTKKAVTGGSGIDVVIQYPFVSPTGFMKGIVPAQMYGHALMRWQ